MTSNLRFLLGLSKNILYWRTIFKFSKIYIPALEDIGAVTSNLRFLLGLSKNIFLLAYHI